MVTGNALWWQVYTKARSVNLRISSIETNTFFLYCVSLEDHMSGSSKIANASDRIGIIPEYFGC